MRCVEKLELVDRIDQYEVAKDKLMLASTQVKYPQTMNEKPLTPWKVAKYLLHTVTVQLELVRHVPMSPHCSGQLV